MLWKIVLNIYVGTDIRLHYLLWCLPLVPARPHHQIWIPRLVQHLPGSARRSIKAQEYMSKLRTDCPCFKFKLPAFNWQGSSRLCNCVWSVIRLWWSWCLPSICVACAELQVDSPIRPGKRSGEDHRVQNWAFHSLFDLWHWAYIFNLKRWTWLQTCYPRR